jgi:MFS family permease
LVLSAISADIFHGKHFGAIFGYFTFSIGLGGAIGAWLGGFLLTSIITIRLRCGFPLRV